MEKAAAEAAAAESTAEESATAVKAAEEAVEAEKAATEKAAAAVAVAAVVPPAALEGAAGEPVVSAAMAAESHIALDKVPEAEAEVSAVSAEEVTEASDSEPDPAMISSVGCPDGLAHVF